MRKRRRGRRVWNEGKEDEGLGEMRKQVEKIGVKKRS